MKNEARQKCLGFALMIFICLGNILYAQTPRYNNVTGKWSGTIEAMGSKIRVVINLEEKDGKLTGKADSPDQKIFGIAIDTITINADEIRVVMNSVSGEFKGKLNPGNNLIEGTWLQGGMSFPLALKKEAATEKPQEEIQYTSYWQGNLLAGGKSLPFILKLFKNEDGTTSGHLDSPAQNVKNIPIKLVEFSVDTIRFKVESIGGSYLGVMEKDSPVVKGKWSQGGATFPLDLKKVDKIVGPNRPQTPKKPYPYNDEEVVFENKTANIKLAGTFTYPKDGGKYPAVVLVTGSGRQDRDETLFEHKPFLVISDYLTRRGIAVLRFDDRGFGKSEGNFAAATSADFVTDALSAVEYLKTRKEVIANKVGIIGHSEGGMIAPMSASQSGEVNFIVMLAGPGVQGNNLIVRQIELIMKANGKSDEETKKSVEESAQFFNIVVNEPDSAKAYGEFKNLYEEKIKTLSEEERKKPEYSEAAFQAQAKTMLSPWFRFFLKYDPAPALENVTIPVLALNGERDIQVDPKQNLPAIESALKSAGNKNYKIVELPGLNHAFQHCKTCTETEYGQLEETFAPEALKVIGDWILSISK